MKQGAGLCQPFQAQILCPIISDIWLRVKKRVLLTKEIGLVKKAKVFAGRQRQCKQAANHLNFPSSSP
jgi:hypothetical protein